MSKNRPSSSRRSFLKQSGVIAAGTAVGGLALERSAHAAGSDTFKIALVGCGGRGTGAAHQALSTKQNVKLIALADAFRPSLDRCLKTVRSLHADRVDVPKERQFVGLDAYEKAIEAGPDVVLLCGPPGFRPRHFEAAVGAGKHVFMEKPVATDGPGIRRMIETNKKAVEKGLLVAVGLHMRHETNRIEAMKMLHDGVIGDILFQRAYFNSSGVWVRPRREGESEMSHQVNNWYYFTWLSGDHIVEQHVHDLDQCNWVKQTHPVSANGMGGRQVRTGPNVGEIYDHHAVEYTYPDGSKMFSFSRHIPNCWNSFSEHAHGTKGRAELLGHAKMAIYLGDKKIKGWNRGKDGHQVEHDDLFGALAAGKTYNEAEYGITASMTAILGRMATYSGKIVTWEEAMKSDLDLTPEKLAFDAETKVKPGEDGCYACAMPGITKAF